MATIAEELAKAAVTDSFLRNEDPLSNEGKWTKPSWCVLIGDCTLGTGWNGESTFGQPPDGARWGTGFGSTGTKHYYSILELSQYSSPQLAERWFATWICLDESEESGYRVKAEFIEGSNYKIKLEKVEKGTAEVLGEAEAEISEPNNGAIAIVLNEGTLYAYVRKEEASEYVEQVKVEDATFTEGLSGIESDGNFFFGRNFRTGVFELGGSGEGVVNPPAANAAAAAPAPSPAVITAPDTATATADLPGIEVATGPMPSSTNENTRGLPLPHPNVLANPARLGPPRFTALERKTLGLD